MSDEKTTWKEQITERMKDNNDGWVNMEDTTLTKEELDAEFNPGYGGTEGCDFTLWTKHFVYFPASYDGSEWCASVPRNPNGHKTVHIGGG